MNKNISIENLSKLTIFSKYAKFIPELNRRESWTEIVDRAKSMHLDKFPQLSEDIHKAFDFVKDKKIVPSMRSMQFGGKPIKLNNSRLYNCAFIAIERIKDFSEIMFLLLSGVGIGFSVQKHHILQLPAIKKPKKSKKFLIGDSIEGWSDAIRALFKAYFQGGTLPLFSYSDIREKGMPLITSGGKAPGPEPLKRCLNKIDSILAQKNEGEKLTSIEVYDIVCIIADAVLSGGIRRSSLICLFDKDDKDMLNAKGNFKVQIDNGGFHFNRQTNFYEGEVLYNNKAYYIVLTKKQYEEFMLKKTLPWWYFEPHRARSNNSITLMREDTTYDEFKEIWKLIKENGTGEPGFYWTNDKDYGINPCAEISLKSRQFCNLTEVNLSTVIDQKDLEERIRAAAIIGTLQASYTDFHYISNEWKENAEKDALLGISLTGIADIDYTKFDWESAAKVALDTNTEFAAKIGINKASRLLTIKPSGTTSLVLGTSSGIHARYAPYYIRRIRYNKNEPIAQYLINNHPEIVEDEFGNSENIVVSIPISAPADSRFRTESAIEFLERVKFFLDNWIKLGHIKGPNTHNVSCTVNIKNNEWREVERWAWENRFDYNTIAVLPYDNGTYIQAPFEEIDEIKFNELNQYAKEIDLTNVFETEDLTSHRQEVACAGNACEISF